MEKVQVLLKQDFSTDQMPKQHHRSTDGMQVLTYNSNGH